MRSYLVIIDKRETTYESEKNIIPLFSPRVKLENVTVRFDHVRIFDQRVNLISELCLFSLKAIVSQKSRTLNVPHQQLS